MGNSNSIIVAAIHTEKDEFYAGDVVQGTVFLKATESISSRFLHLSFIAREFGSVMYTSNSRTDNEHYDEGEKIFWEKDFVLEKFQDEMLSEGEYEYPFSFKLPIGLPSSFSCSFGRSTSKIEYTLKVRLFKPEGEYGLLAYELKHLKVTAVRLPHMTDRISPSIPEPGSFKTNICCCFNKGEVVVAGQTEVDKYSVGDPVEVAFSIDDKTKKQDLDTLSVILFQRIDWIGLKGYHHACSHSSCGGKVQMDIDFCDEDLEHPKTMNTFTNKINNYVKFHVREPNNHSNVLIPTYVGKYITVSHFIEIRMKAGFCLGEMKYKIPVYIIPPDSDKEISLSNVSSSATNLSSDFKRSEAIEGLPENWSGSVRKSTSFDFDPFAIDEDEVTFQTMIDKMSKTFNSFMVLQRIMSEVDDETGKLKYKKVFQQMLPGEYSTLLGKIPFDLDKIEAAEMVAKMIGESFTCEYIEVAMDNVGSLEKAKLVKLLVPLAADFKEEKETISDKLDFFDLEKCKPLFD